MKRNPKALWVAVAFILVAISVSPVLAISISGVTITEIGCTGWTGSGTRTTTRDNTGTGSESYAYRARDGAGTTIYLEPYLRPVNTSAGFGGVPWNLGSPAYNPITLDIVSYAGNGLPEESVLIGIGNCAGLPTYTGPALVFQGKPLPAGSNLVLFLGDTAILDGAGGNPTGLAMRTCKTEFVLEKSADGRYGRLYQQGGWVDLSNTLDVPEDYGQPGGTPIYPLCVGK